jgi:hypothetical protein
MGRIKVTHMRSVPTTRGEFERNLHILRELIEQRRLHFHADISFESFLRARLLPNGRIDLTSIDESLRLHANMSANMDEFSTPNEEEDESQIPDNEGRDQGPNL